MKTRVSRAAIVGEMPDDLAIAAQPHEELVRPPTANRDALRQFVDAVVALSDEPGPANLERYLAASRSLEEARLETSPY